MKFRIALVQFGLRRVKPVENLAHAEELVRKAAARGADVVIFPEEFMVGGLVGTKLVVKESTFYRERLQAIASKYHVDLVGGSCVEQTERGLQNTAHYIDASGKILASYAKINLYLSERRKLTPGDKVTVFKTRFGKAGMAICWDITSPEIFREMALRGAEVVYCPSFWWHEIAKKGREQNVAAEIIHVDALCLARAIENNVILAYANMAGNTIIEHKRETLFGHSQITAPLKGVVTKMNHDREEVRVIEVDTEVIRTAEQSYRLRGDIRSLRARTQIDQS